MLAYLKRHKEAALLLFIGIAVVSAFNAMMLCYNYEAWVNPKVGFWTAFSSKFEVSGFDCFTYIIISKWRPLYVLSRHPLLAMMVWPLSQLNILLRDITGINCTIHIVAVVWGVASLCSWMLFYHLMRRTLSLRFPESLLLTLFFFSFSHVMLTLFTPDHMTLTLPLLLLSVILSARAINQGRLMPLWQTLLLCLVSTGITTTNCVKIYIADLFAMWRRCSLRHWLLRSAAYLLPLALIAAAFVWQTNTTQREEERYAESIIAKRSAKDSVFAEMIQQSLENTEKVHNSQIIGIDGLTNTEYHIDRLPSLTENVFGEGFILHETCTLKDANRHRPVLIRYTNPANYVFEAMILILFVIGIWYGRHERIVWMTLTMFLFDMILHVGMNFASADVYIMTAHWAFVIPVCIAFTLKKGGSRMRTATLAAVLFLTVYMWIHNTQLTASHLLKLSL